ILNFGKFIQQSGPHRSLKPRMMVVRSVTLIGAPGIKGLYVYPVDIFFVRVHLIEAVLVDNKKIDQYTKGDTDAESEGIDEGIQLALEDIAGSDLDVVVDH